jgi:hypothetical protein
MEWWDRTHKIEGEGHYLYSELWGYLDPNHFSTGNPIKVIEDVEKAIAKGGDEVRIEQPLSYDTPFGRVTLIFVGIYYVSGDATPDQAIGIALGIYMDWSVKFEAWQAITIIGPGSLSSFSMEDLPSHCVGFYAAATGQSVEQVLAQLGGDWRRTSQEPPKSPAWRFEVKRYAWFVFISPVVVTGAVRVQWELARNTEFKNYSFNPMVQDAEGNWYEKPWPAWMTITPIGSESGLWRFQDAYFTVSIE